MVPVSRAAELAIVGVDGLPSGAVAAGALLAGLGLGFGLWVIVAALPRSGRGSLRHRVAPYLADISEEARLLVTSRPADPLPVLGTLFSPYLFAAAAGFGAVLGGGGAVALRLRQAGSAATVREFRARQLSWTVCGGLGGLLAGAALSAVHIVQPWLLVAIACSAALAGLVACDRALQRAARSRLRRMAAELPTVLELLSLSMSAGEGILDAIRRVAAAGRGELAAELGRVVAAVGSGAPLGGALEEMASALRWQPWSRCVEQLVAGLERGTPLVRVLLAQAEDARGEAKRGLLESAGRKEVGMMLPLVFLLLPITVVIAIFPGVFVLQAGF